jgi:hypothetical protein
MLASLCWRARRALSVFQQSAQRTPFDAICRHRFAVSGTAEDNAPFGFAAGHGQGNRSDEKRIVDRRF